jgi:hypothetical protein
MGVDRNVYKVLVDVKMVSKWILGRQAGVGVQWMHLAQDRDQLQALVNAPCVYLSELVRVVSYQSYNILHSLQINIDNHHKTFNF